MAYLVEEVTELSYVNLIVFNRVFYNLTNEFKTWLSEDVKYYLVDLLVAYKIKKLFIKEAQDLIWFVLIAERNVLNGLYDKVENLIEDIWVFVWLELFNDLNEKKEVLYNDIVSNQDELFFVIDMLCSIDKFDQLVCFDLKFNCDYFIFDLHKLL